MPRIKELASVKYQQKMLIRGGPGTGKTELISERVVHLVEMKNLNPRAILILSFTRNSVRELKERIKKKLSRNNDQIFFKLKIMTFDRFAAKILQDNSDYKIFSYNYENNISNAIDLIRNFDNRTEEFRYFFSTIEYIIVDEIQDLCFSRAALLQCIFNTLFKVDNEWGYLLLLDECQEIFSYMATKTKSKFKEIFKRSNNFINWAVKWTKESYPEDFLEETLTSSIQENPRFYSLDNKKLFTIIENSRFILEKYPKERDKLLSIKNRFPLLTITSENEFFKQLREDPKKNICILFRANETALNFSLKLYQQKPPIFHVYQLKNQNTIFPSWIAYNVKYSIDKNAGLDDDIHIEKEKFIEISRNINIEQRFNISPENAWAFLSSMVSESEEFEEIRIKDLKYGLIRNYSEMLLQEYGFIDASIIISNIHKSKGREYDFVFLEDAVINKNFSLEDVQEFARLNYVALTRCKKDFKLISSQNRSFYSYRVSDEFKDLGPYVYKIIEKKNDNVIKKISFLSPKENDTEKKQEKIWNLILGDPVKIEIKINPPNNIARVFTLEQDPNIEIELCVLDNKITNNILKNINYNIKKKKIQKKNNYILLGARIVSLNSELLPSNIKEYNQVEIPYKYFLIGYWIGFRIMGPLYIKK